MSRLYGQTLRSSVIATCGGRTPAAAVGISAWRRSSGPHSRSPRRRPDAAAAKTAFRPHDGLRGVAVGGLDEENVTTLVNNYTRWCERNSSPGGPAASVYGILVLFRKEFGVVTLTGQVDPGTWSRPPVACRYPTSGPGAATSIGRIRIFWRRSGTDQASRGPSCITAGTTRGSGQRSADGIPSRSSNILCR